MLNTIQVALIVGASSGVGLACVRHLHKTKKFRIFSASRTSSDELEKLSTFIETDVTDDDSVQRLVQRVVEECGEVDLLVHAAGYALAGSIEGTTVEEAQRQFDTNFWGLVRVNKAIVPRMRELQRGTIINIGSLAGLVPLPFQAYYSASKFAVEAFCEVLHYEVRPFGIRVYLVQPGDLKTQLTQNRRIASACLEDNPYFARFTRCMKSVHQMELGGQSPDKVARKVLQLANSQAVGSNSKLRYRVSQPLEELGLAIRRLGFYRTFSRVLRSRFGDFRTDSNF